VPIDVRDRKLLWGRSGNRCAFPDCRQTLLLSSQGAADGIAVLGREAHIVARKNKGPRADPTMPQSERDSYRNLILLCPTHHDLIDSDPDTWTVSRLHAMKIDRETAMAPVADSQAQRRDEAWASLVDDFTTRMALDAWAHHMSGLLRPNQGIRQSSLSRLYGTCAWLNARIYPIGYPNLVRAFNTIRTVLSDLIDTFEIYSDAQDEAEPDPYIHTPKFYKRGGWNENYHADAEKYGQHLNLVADLALELNRAINWLCDVVREELDPLFLVETGALQMLGGPFEDGNTRWLRPEYGNDAAGDTHPYVDLDQFKSVRYLRDFHSPQP
jgi:hypothetical protein